MGKRIILVEQFGKPTFTSLRTIGNTTVGNNLIVSGSITAQSLVVNTKLDAANVEIEALKAK
jgi:hypothetical protein